MEVGVKIHASATQSRGYTTLWIGGSLDSLAVVEQKIIFLPLPRPAPFPNHSRKMLSADCNLEILVLILLI
jgi:hypothetical protein